ncbi:NAD(P)H-dependent flavin oxidoreductase [Nocardia sp. NBC_01329]|uniref:NAD(P)H-dependent flavin oxidoreductase n=1 Tax=Nocardia sp. NBC_01329 TaxID=2903594 RepID=UPI002E151F15|nr:nitronate monooxygenase [Nocardia sp. NBC_01329]
MAGTPWSDRMGLSVPIVNAPMGGVAGGRLAAAVSAAGGLGMIGMGSSGSVSALEHELTQLDPKPTMFGIGTVAWVVEREPALLDTALAARPALVSVGFTEDWSWVDRVHAAGVSAVTQVYDADHARRAAAAGVDVLVARGSEGGGHGDPRLGTLAVLDAVLEAVTVPVLAAGGIATARGLAAVLAAGASGAWLGTCLSVCPEALTPEPAREALLRARATDTVVTRVFDLGQRLPWPDRYPARVLSNETTLRWAGREEQLSRDDKARDEVAAAVATDDPRLAPVDAGAGVGALTRARPAGAVVAELFREAESLLRQRQPTGSDATRSSPSPGL